MNKITSWILVLTAIETMLVGALLVFGELPVGMHMACAKEIIETVPSNYLEMEDPVFTKRNHRVGDTVLIDTLWMPSIPPTQRLDSADSAWLWQCKKEQFDIRRGRVKK